MADWTPIYKAGTASPSNGIQTVNGQGTNWLTAGLRAGDQFKAAGLSVSIQSVTSNTQLILAEGWPGANRANLPYEILRVSDADRMVAASADLMQVLVPNLTAFGGLSGQANKLPWFSGAGALSLADLTPQARQLLDDGSFDTMLTTLGGGAVGREAFKAATKGAFLTNAGIAFNVGVIADDAAVTINLGSGVEAAYVLVTTNVPNHSAILAARTHTGSNSVLKVAQGSSTVNVYGTALTGTTGADGALNFGVGASTPNNLYVENRLGSAVGPFYFYVLKQGW